MTASFRIVPCTSSTQPGWLDLRSALWPDDAATHRVDMAAALAAPERFAQWIAHAVDGPAVGLLEASLRHDYVNGTTTSPVAFVEGLYVDPAYRRRGVARALLRTVTDWGCACGCTELASDAPLDNLASQAMHAALGFVETERVVAYRKDLVR